MRNLFKTSSPTIILILSFLFFVSCKDKDATPKDTAIDLALADSRFSVFTKLLTDNNLVGSLKTGEPFTIFAPTNEAFSKIDVGKFTKTDLVKLLNTHIVRERRLLTNEIKSGLVQSPQRIEVYLSKNSSGIFVNAKSKVISPDITASNGVIHVVDNVITLPTQNLAEILRKDPQFSEFFSLIELSSTVETSETMLGLPSPFGGSTILAPTNEAFAELYKIIPKATLLADKQRLKEIIDFHRIGVRRIFSVDFPDSNQPVNTTLSIFAPIVLSQSASAGFPITTPAPDITITGSFKGQYQVVFDVTDGLKVKGVRSSVANITSADLLATNGVIHKLDRVLLP
ncbi:MAG: fasciclin domain-containing protein [Emticicia sp.]|uniref:fasciclin domain-containing protein n=1 Tax=Emticicia sp. TaxID=1930953 RepID=UPI003BA72416